jgi:hypothetical protein
MKLTIRLIDGFWTINKKRFHEMNEVERDILARFLTNIFQKTIKHL